MSAILSFLSIIYVGKTSAPLHLEKKIIMRWSEFKEKIHLSLYQALLLLPSYSDNP